jgi:hypothetical protein
LATVEVRQDFGLVKPGVERQAGGSFSLVGSDLKHETAGPRQPVARRPDDGRDRLEARGPGDESRGRLPLLDLGRKLLAGGDIWRVGHDEVDGSGQLGRQRVPPTPLRKADPGAGGRPHAGDVRTGDGQGVMGDVGGPHVHPRYLDGQREPDCSRPGAQVNGEATTSKAQRPQLLDRNLDDDLRLRPGDQDPAVEEQVEMPEPPPAYDVLERLARGAPGKQRVVLGLRSRPLADPTHFVVGDAQLKRRSVGIAAELTTSLVGDERVDELIEISQQHLVQVVDRQPDPVVGDPVVLVVIRADLL